MEDMQENHMESKEEGKRGLGGFLPIIMFFFLLFSLFGNFMTVLSSYVLTQLTLEPPKSQVTIPPTQFGSGSLEAGIGTSETYDFDLTADPLSTTLANLSERHTKWDGFAAVQLVVSVLLMIAAAFLLYLFFKKSKRFPTLFIWFLIINAVFSVANTAKSFFVLFGPSALTQVTLLLPVMLVALVVVAWVVSVKRSERVRLTFVD